MQQDINRIINWWIAQLDHYTYEQLLVKPSVTGWSIGQLYMHLITDTKFYIENIEACMSGGANMHEEASAFARELFRNNEFPDIRIKGHPNNACMPQPESKEQIHGELVEIQQQLNELADLVIAVLPKGKTRHPGLGYFNAKEWLHFTDIHFRHHQRQKERIDADN